MRSQIICSSAFAWSSVYSFHDNGRRPWNNVRVVLILYTCHDDMRGGKSTQRTTTERRHERTFICRTVQYDQVKVIRFTEVVGYDNLFLELKDGDTSPVKVHARLVLSGFELVEH